jgi:hypothetical protein
MGTGIAPGASITPTFLTFPLQTVGTVSAQQTVTVASTGSSQLTVASVVITGEFTQTNNVVGNLQSGAAGSIEVQFRPLAPGTLTGSLVITHNAANSPVTIALSGTAQAAVPGIAASLSSILFRAAGTINVTLTSTGTAPLSITSSIVAPPAPVSIFTLASALGSATLAPNAQFIVSVKCTPGTTIGVVPSVTTANLIITHNAPGSPLTIPLSYSALKIIEIKQIETKVIELFKPVAAERTEPAGTAAEGTGRAFITPEERPELGPRTLENADADTPNEDS